LGLAVGVDSFRMAINNLLPMALFIACDKTFFFFFHHKFCFALFFSTTSSSLSLAFTSHFMAKRGKKESQENNRVEKNLLHGRLHLYSISLPNFVC
jgi:hypothetical protein